MNFLTRRAGSPQHIKNKFGDGYTLVIKVRHSTAPIKDEIQRVFPGAIMEEEHRGYLHYRLPSASITSFPTIFSTLERTRVQFDLEDYELTQTSLEAIFCKFALAQQDEDDRSAAAKKRKPRTATTVAGSARYASVNADPLAMDELHAVETDDDEEEDPMALGYDAQQSLVRKRLTRKDDDSARPNSDTTVQYAPGTGTMPPPEADSNLRARIKACEPPGVPTVGAADIWRAA